MGAWIETLKSLFYASVRLVAPYVGAWIETAIALQKYREIQGRTLRGCVD